MASYPSTPYAPASKSGGQTIQASFFNDPDAELTALEMALLTSGLAHHLIFVDATYDIGQSGATRPRHIYISGRMTGGVLPRVTSVTTSTTPTPNVDTTDAYDITALASAAAFGAPTGTPQNFQKLLIRIKDDGTARALTWNAAYVAGGTALPSTTVLSKILTIGFIYNTANSLNKWQCVGAAQEA